jgi:hypothetical protein
MPFRATMECCLMNIGKKRVASREFRVTITVEEVEVPKVADIPDESETFSAEAEDFIEEAGYSRGGITHVGQGL